MNPEPPPPEPSPKFSSPETAAPVPPVPPPMPAVSARPGRVPPLFRPVDWLALAICFFITGLIYYLTLAPEVTLEDSGELTTGSFWAGIPHPPGYPFWAIYSWLWTQLVPFGNVAWRVELGEAAASAMGCSLIAFMVSRGGSMLMESIESLRAIPRRFENAICLVCGVTAGLLMALDNSMWKESVAINRISVFGVPWLIIVLLCLLRWIYAPHQRRYLYTAMFFFGICATIHQTLVVAAMGIEIGIAMTQPKLGRDLFFGNGLVWAVSVLARATHVWTSFEEVQPMVYSIFNGIGIASTIAFLSLALTSRWGNRMTTGDRVRSWSGAILLSGFILLTGILAHGHGGPSLILVLFGAVALAALIIALHLMTEWPACFFMALLWIAGAAFYFYEPLAGMTDPPMQWGYPRTVRGFFEALTRGQYEKINPTNIFQDRGMFLIQLHALAQGVADAFNWVYMFFGLVPFAFFFKFKRREKNWLITVAAIYPFLGVLLTIFLNPQQDRQSADLLKVFFAASHTVVAILIGYGLVLTAAWMAANYKAFRLWGWLGGGAALILASFCLWQGTGRHYFGLAGAGEITPLELPHWILQAFAPDQYGLPVFANLLLVALPLIFLVALILRSQRPPLLLTLALFAAMPLYSGLAHWFGSEQRGHWFGYWYGHDMFTPPFPGPDGQLTYDRAARAKALQGPDGKLVYPEIAADAVIYGGTDPGRFCPTYMAFCESFIPHSCQPDQDQHFDRRDVYVITQNALADPTYLNYIRAQYNRSLQKDPPFFQNFLPTELPQLFPHPTKSLAWLDHYFEKLGARIEFHRRTDSSRFQPADFLDLNSLAAKLRPGASQDDLSKFLASQLTPETQSLLQNGSPDALCSALARDFTQIIERTNSIYTPARFQNVKLPALLQQAVQSNQIPALTMRQNRRLLEEAYPKEIAPSLGGVYPDTEIHTASYDELVQCEHDYTEDAGRRYMHDQQYPNEPPQLTPGEDIVAGPRGLSFGGIGAVMGINSHVTKVMFDANPGHEFYVEESYPMDWMYPYLLPYGIIMKVNRNPLPELPDSVVERDHKFWSDYSQRLIGNWITYDTTPKELCDFAEKVYLRHDYRGFKGDLKFLRDEDAQKGFSKLRSAIASSIYEWRAHHDPDPADRARMAKEAEFALKQAFACCPWTEAMYRYVQFLLDQQRFDDALLLAKTCLKLDPFNAQVQNMVQQLSGAGVEMRARGPAPGRPGAAELAAAAKTLEDAQTALQAHDTNKAAQLLESVMTPTVSNPQVIMEVAQIYAEMSDLPKSEEAMRRAAKVAPNVSVIWYDLAILLSIEHRDAECEDALGKAVQANDAERKIDARMMDMRSNAQTNPAFSRLSSTPEFRAALAPK